MKRILTEAEEIKLKKFDDDFHTSALHEINVELTEELKNDPKWAENCKDPEFPADDIEYSMYEDRVHKAWGEKLKEFDLDLYKKVCVYHFVRKCDLGTWAVNIDRSICGIVYIPKNYPDLKDSEIDNLPHIKTVAIS